MSWQCEFCNQGSHGNCPDTDCQCEYCWESNQDAKKYAEEYATGMKEPPHQSDCICADCSGAELTADND